MADYLEQDLLANYSNKGGYRPQQQNTSKANAITPLHRDKIDLSGNDPRPITYSAKVSISTPTKGSATKQKTIPKDPNRRASTVLNKMTKNKSKDRSNIFPAKYLVPSGGARKKSDYIQNKLKAAETS